jgi:hypothetical protein
LNLPAKTAYTLTYKATNPAEVWEGGVYFCSTRRLLILNTSVCVFAGLVLASKASFAAFLATFLGIFAATAIFFFFSTFFLAFLHTVSVLFLSKFYGACTTIIDEDGIRDSLGRIKFNYKWHKIRDVEMKNGSIYALALVNGIQIPYGAFANREEAEEVFALAKQYKAAAQQKKNQIAADSDTPVQDPELLLKSLQDEEEAKWLEIENKHKEQNRE